MTADESEAGSTKERLKGIWGKGVEALKSAKDDLKEEALDLKESVKGKMETYRERPQDALHDEDVDVVGYLGFGKVRSVAETGADVARISKDRSEKVDQIFRESEECPACCEPKSVGELSCPACSTKRFRTIKSEAVKERIAQMNNEDG